ncbi:BTAD domain-containing putative transcriptional regulator [Streptomyces sp. NPDC059474]|uniref:AfsR/SARP family transcriptional regulator n=1 Tax=unclassified Streptomyces TaxID=2593676 RepID=UPI0033D37115
MTDLRVSLLGMLQLHRNGTRVDLGSPQQQSLFVALLMRDGRTATAGHLIEAVWGDAEPASAIRTLRTYVWRLRKAFEEDTKSPRILVSVGDGYRLDLEDDYVDFQEVEELTRSAQRARQNDDLKGSYELLEAALSLWRGEPLAGIPGPFAARQRDRLNEVRLFLQEERMEIGLTLGHGTRYISELPGLIDQHPLRERLYTLLMHAQYQSGRRADALDTYRRARSTLDDELGVEPGPELKALQQRVLAGAAEGYETEAALLPVKSTSPSGPASAADEEAAAATDMVPVPPLGPDDLPRPYPAQLPPDLVDFTGRSHLTLTIGSLLTSPLRSALPVAVLVGMAGVGKSALALHVAHTIRDSYPDGQLYAGLRASDGGPVRAHDVLTGFLVSLGYRSDDVPARSEAATALLRSTLNGRRVLLVLDDAVDAEQVRPLLPGSADCGVLVTTRTQLGGLSALHVEVPAFHRSEALDLLTRTIGSERVKAEDTAALEIIESCTMLPLAIRIVAARLAARPHWTLRSLSDRLADEFRRIEELRSGSMTISAVFDLTYRQLPDAQAAALRRAAAVDSPSLSLPCAAALLDVPEDDAEMLLDALGDQAMLESPALGRYRFHGLLRDFARRKAHPDEQQRARARLLDFLLASANNAFVKVVAGDPIAGALSHTRAAGIRFADAGQARSWAAADGECALALVGQMARITAASTGSAQDESPDDTQAPLRSCVDLLIALSALLPSANSTVFRDVVELLQQAVATSQDARTVGRLCFLRGTVELALGHFALAEQHASAAVRLCESSHDLVILRQALNDLGLAKQMQGEFQSAVACYDKAVNLARRLGHATGEVVTMVNSALLRVHMGEPDTAVQICRRVLTELVVQIDNVEMAYTHYVLGLATHDLGEYESAVGWFEECLAVCVSSGLRAREGHARLRLAESLRAVELLDRALAEARLAVQICEEVNDGRNLVQAHIVQGNALLDLGQEAAAQESFTRADELFSGLRSRTVTGAVARLGAPHGGQASGAGLQRGISAPAVSLGLPGNDSPSVAGIGIA